MQIVSPHFFIFVFCSAIIYHLIQNKFKLPWLFTTSIFFYTLIDVRYAIVLIIITSANYWFARESLKSIKGKRFNYAAIAVNLLSLILIKWLVSKYVGITLPGVDVFQGVWLLPAGFSFYILQLISFQTEVQNGKIKILPGWVEFYLYVSYFPKLLSGPIEKPTQFLQKLQNPLMLDNTVFARAIGLIFNGLIRKVVIANVLSALIPSIFQNELNISLLSIISFGIILYNDFYGYTCIVRGVSLLFGIELSLNFMQPYMSRNLSEFWSRWHLSLTIWLRENIFFPVSRHLARQYNISGSIISIIVPPMLTMLASGLWHGFSLGMIVWGALHGLVLIFERVLYGLIPLLRPNRLNKLGSLTSILLTYTFVNLSWIPFAAPNLKQTIRILITMTIKPIVFGDFNPVVPIFLIASSFLLDFLVRRSENELWWQDMSFPARTFGLALFLLMLISAIVYQIQVPGEVFIYQGF